MLKKFLKAIGYNGVIGFMPLFLFLFSILFPAYMALIVTDNIVIAVFSALGGMKLYELISKVTDTIYKKIFE